MLDSQIGSMKSLITLIISLLLGSALCGQKPLWPKTELQQIVDLEHSIVLIPLLDEPETSSISIGRDPELMRIREVNAAIIAGANKRFDFSKTLFFSTSDSSAVYSGQFQNRLSNANGEQVGINKSISELFVAEFLEPSHMTELEVIVYNKRQIKRQERKNRKHQDIINELERQIVLESDPVRIAKKTEKTAWHQAKIIDVMTPKNVSPEHDHTKSYWAEKEYFHAESADHRRLVIRRMEGKEIVASKKVTYKVNWNFVARLHTSVDENTKYFEAFGFLNKKLIDRKAELTKDLGIEMN